MNSYISMIIIIAIFALVIVGAFAVYKLRITARIKGPFNTEVEINGSNEQPQGRAAVNIEDAKSHKGGILVEDQTGIGVNITRSEVEQDIIVSSGFEKGKHSPKV